MQAPDWLSSVAQNEDMFGVLLPCMGHPTLPTPCTQIQALIRTTRNFNKQRAGIVTDIARINCNITGYIQVFVPSSKSSKSNASWMCLKRHIVRECQLQPDLVQAGKMSSDLSICHDSRTHVNNTDEHM